MAAPKRPTHVVTHPSVYLRVDGKLQEMGVGDQLALTAKEVGGMVEKKFVACLKDGKVVEIDTDSGEGQK